jgi:hypothetical protein
MIQEQLKPLCTYDCECGETYQDELYPEDTSKCVYCPTCRLIRNKRFVKYMENSPAQWSIDTTDNIIYRKIKNGLQEVSLDSNSARECVQEMEKRFENPKLRSDYERFEGYAKMMWRYGKHKFFIAWLMNPENFWDCFSKWLEGRDE